MKGSVENGSYQVKSVLKAMKLLDLMADTNRPMHLQELAHMSGLPTSTVYGLLNSMRENAVIEQSPETGCYSLGIRLFEYGCRISARWDVVTQGCKFVQDLSQKSGFTAFISRLYRDEAVILDHSSPANAFRVITDNGERTPLYCTAQGKVLLAFQSTAELKRYVSSRTLVPFTPHTITDPQKLEAEMAKIREEGCAIEDGEFKIGLRAVAAPILSWGGTVEYCIGLVGLFRRTFSEEFERAKRLTIETARQLSHSVGYQ